MVAYPMKEPPAFVIDCSVALSWFFADEDSAYANAVARNLTTVTAVAPCLWPIEVANALLVGERRSRCTSTQTSRWLEDVGVLAIAIDHEAPMRAWTYTLELARKHDLSAYDAAYLELA